MRIIALVVIFLFLNLPATSAALYKRFVVSPEIYKQYKESYPKLHLGMNKEEVMQLMGKPHVDQEIITKKGIHRGSSISYYIVRDNPNLVNEKLDQVFIIYFDPDGKLNSATPKNIKGFSQIEVN